MVFGICVNWIAVASAVLAPAPPLMVTPLVAPIKPNETDVIVALPPLKSICAPLGGIESFISNASTPLYFIPLESVIDRFGRFVKLPFVTCTCAVL